MLVVEVASSREDAWIETDRPWSKDDQGRVASSREDAWIETGYERARDAFQWSRPPARTRGLKLEIECLKGAEMGRVLPRGRVD